MKSNVIVVSAQSEAYQVQNSLILHLLEDGKWFGKVSAQPHTIVKQICFPNGNVLFLSLFSLFKN